MSVRRSQHGRRGLARFDWVVYALAAGSGVGFSSGAGETTRLCLQKLREIPLPNVEPVGLSTFGGPRDPTITIWSRSALIVFRMWPGEARVRSVVQVALPDMDVLAAATTDWQQGGPFVELIDPQLEAVWSWDLATKQMTKSMALPSVGSAFGVLRGSSDWVLAHEIMLPLEDTSGIVISRLGQHIPLDQSTGPETTGDTGRRLDQILHMRPDNQQGYLITKAAFPFSVVRFTPAGDEVWRTAAHPDSLREVLQESDLRYVFATPAIAIDDATFNTFVALRSGRRVSALMLADRTSVRYHAIPNDVAFLGTMPGQRVLLATRRGQPNELVLFGWRWIGQRESCT